MKKGIVFAISAITTSVFAGQSAFADATTIPVASAEEYISAFNTIDSANNSEFIISLDNDIILNDASFTKTVANGNSLTILGNNHSITYALDSKNRLTTGTGGTITLGKSDGSDKLTIMGPETEISLNSLVNIYNGGTLNMYDGVELTRNNGVGELSGAAIRAGAGATINIYGGSIHDIYSRGGGFGIVTLDQPGATLNMFGGEIKNTLSSGMGGAIYASENANVTITGGSFINNKTRYDMAPSGGAISFMSDGELKVSNATFTDNEAILTENASGSYAFALGGAIGAAWSGPVTIDSCTFTGNKSYRENSESETKTYGGAIGTYMTGGSAIAVKNSTFENNQAARGGAIGIWRGVATLENNTYTSNEAIFGGAIYSANPLVSKTSTITDNSAVYGGGAFVSSSTADLSTTKIYNNHATDGASDIYISENVTEISIMSAADMNASATIDGSTVQVEDWYTDDEENANTGARRYSVANPTEVVANTSITPGNEYYLVAASSTVVTPEPETPNTAEEVDENPATSDNVIAYANILIVSCICLTISILSSRIHSKR